MYRFYRGVLSPLLWNMVLDSLLNRLNSDNFSIVAYADNLVILQTGRFENILCERMQVALRSIEKWCEDHSLSVNPKKTEMVLFTRKRKLPDLKAPELFKTKRNFSTEVKYLGITFDKKLTWNSHLEKRVKKAYISYEQCRRTMGQTWGLYPRIALWIYTAIIRHMLTIRRCCLGSKSTTKNSHPKTRTNPKNSMSLYNGSHEIYTNLSYGGNSWSHASSYTYQGGCFDDYGSLPPSWCRTRSRCR